MAQEYQIVRIIPDKKGKGGDKSGMTTHMGVVDIYSNQNALMYAGRWRSMLGAVAYTTGYQNNSTAWECKSIHVYYQYSTTSAVSEPTVHLFGHHYEGATGNYDVLWNYTDSYYLEMFKSSTVYSGACGGGFGFAFISSITGGTFSATDAGRYVYIWAWDGGLLKYRAYRSVILQVLAPDSLLLTDDIYATYGTYQFVVAKRVWTSAPNAASIAKFVNVANRCFIAWGNTTWGNLIVDTSFVTEGGLHLAMTYPMGCPAPVNNITYTLTTPYNGVCGITNDTIYATVAGCKFFGSAPAITPSLQMNVAGQTFSVTALTLENFTDTVTIAADGVTYSIPAGNPYANGLGLYTAYPAGFGTITTISVDGLGNIVGKLDTSNTPGAHAGIQVGAGHWYIAQLSDKFTAAPIYNAPFTMNTGGMNWTGTGPSYAVARYNPSTGHVSNIGPITTVTEQNQNITQINLQIPVDGQSSDYFQAGYTKLILFRTPLANTSGGTLLPIGDPTLGGAGLIDNFNPATAMIPSTVTFADNYTDSALVLSSTFIAPQAINNQPPTFCQLAFWDNVVWGVDIADQSAVRYSVFPNQNGYTFGVTQEAFPSENVLRIPAEDGRILGMKPVGATLIITTQRYAYSIAGTLGAYSLVRFCTNMYGVVHERFCEWAGDAGEASDRLAFIGNDGKFYRFTPNYGTEVISAPIATSVDASFTAGADLSPFKIHQIISKGYRLFLFTLGPDQGSARWMFDYENGTWHKYYSAQPQPQAFTQIYSGAAAPIQLYGYAGTLYKWFDDSITAYNDAIIQTFTIDGGSPETFKELLAVRLWVSDSTQTYTIRAVSDEGGSISGETRAIVATAASEPDRVRSPQNTGITGYKLDAINASALIAWMGQPFVGHRFWVSCEWGNTAQSDIYAIDLFFKPVEGQPAG